MKWSIHELSKYRQNGMPIDTVVQLDEVKKRNNEIRHISPVHVKGHCTFGASQMTCQFTMAATLTLPCARTWEDVEFPIHVETVEIFSWIDPELRGNEEDEDIHYVDGEVIDLKPVLEELVLLEIPMQVFKEGSEGQVQGGKNWSYSTDEDIARQKENDEQKVDPRLANLAKYFDQTDE
ncbi:metal-binding protein [Ureibacillus massiliensis 4400831 = CIP 108448 = CCUG 49529]|uniref:Metal-binding protein n=1 Tax=Ureibacillus massiliensis 4400831 = CIP 108448 = CCUG 49529 TaxID=1211035 RepID=A0A0A3J5G9_9BACL|nr:YceD family protein [Ureibacillus massiliensis]KGR92176.1 metal-binding protein [Ureibacillus massiliensis 4400831 = CIP 108448 = CCUG 49529]